MTLIIRDLQVEDAGSYTCGNQVQALLTVITPPACSPTPPLPDIPEEEEMQLSCAVQSRGPSKPTLSWLVSEYIDPSKPTLSWLVNEYIDPSKPTRSSGLTGKRIHESQQTHSLIAGN